MPPPATIRPLAPLLDAARCDEIVASLPMYFGDPGGIADCARSVRTERGWVAECEGVVLGFATTTVHPTGAAEITWLAVHHDERRRGIGHRLTSALEAALAEDGVTELLVLTLGPSVPDEGYAGTRRFWKHEGYVPLRELRLSDWVDGYALVSVKRLTPAG